MRSYLYGITEEEYVVMLEAQGHACAICGSKEWPGKDNRPHVDHCHSTGRVRGILCGRCNVALGLMDDDAGRLRTAAEYLERERR
ncbi:endonuclease VII domain-containing protein [Streptomyces hydrogenans]|nr:endonuclease VII domain-containing protein [Streptomyces hydrogenans]